jgi:hypothetical protein
VLCSNLVKIWRLKNTLGYVCVFMAVQTTTWKYLQASTSLSGPDARLFETLIRPGTYARLLVDTGEKLLVAHSSKWTRTQIFPFICARKLYPQGLAGRSPNRAWSACTTHAQLTVATFHNNKYRVACHSYPLRKLVGARTICLDLIN